ncbi:MAG TPA: NAD-dependent epimerase/dehydratase family protein [Gemmatimonadaceae bacterium]|nr:NAD-dependent epimerase/dehydratase family protein [Gemmatimonadaceae bacterium]
MFVTGASGFLGHALCKEWVERGLHVRGFIRRGSKIPSGVEPVFGDDLRDEDSLRRGMHGAGVVVHLAARVHQMRETSADAEAQYRAVNVEGTRAVLSAATHAGVEKVVITSSVKAVGERSERPWTELTPPEPLDAYGRSKLEAERLALSCAHDMAVSVLRLPAVYGPQMKGNIPQLFALVKRGIPVPLGAVHNRRSFLYSGNAVRAVDAVLASDAAAGSVFFVSDDDDVSAAELVRRIAAAMGRPARLVPVPLWMLRAGARIVDPMHGLFGLPAMRPAIARLTESLQVDITRLRKTTHYTPIPMRDALQETAMWYEGALARPR